MENQSGSKWFSLPLLFLVQGARGGGALDEHSRSLPQPAGDVRLLLATFLHWAEEGDRPLS